MAGIPKEAIELRDQAKHDSGAFIRFEGRGNGHLAVINQKTGSPIRDAEGKPLHIPSTPGDWRAWANEAARWRRAGLIAGRTKPERAIEQREVTSKLERVRTAIEYHEDQLDKLRLLEARLAPELVAA